MRPSAHSRLRRRLKTTAVIAAFALATTSCGIIGGDENSTASGDEAAVSVGGVESGCAAAIDLSLLLGGAPQPSITPDDMARYASDVEVVKDEFSNRPDTVTDYLDVVSEVVSKAADQAADEDDPSAEQIMLLLQFEQAGRRAELDRLTPEADSYFRATCGSAYSEVSDSMSIAAAASDDTGPTATDPVDEPNATTAQPDETTTTTIPLPSPSLVTEDTSVGANGVYLTMEIEVGEIWRTNLTPDAAINGGTELGEDEIVMVGIRFTSTGASFFYDESDFGWVSADGERMNAIHAVTATGGEWNARIDANESKRGFLIFPGTLGATEGAVLQAFGGDTVAENITLGSGAESSPYPFDIPQGQTGSGILTNGTSSICEYPTNIEIRSAMATLDGYGGNQRIMRPRRNERFVSFVVGFEVLEVNGNACDWATTVYGNLTNMRLRLDNGDVVGPLDDVGRLEVGETVARRLEFAVPQDIERFELLLDDDSVVASWSGISLPGA